MVCFGDEENAVSIQKLVRGPLNLARILGILCASLRQAGERDWKARAQRLKQTRQTYRKPFLREYLNIEG